MKHKTTNPRDKSKFYDERLIMPKVSNVVTIGSFMFIGIPSLVLPVIENLYGTNGMWGFIICLFLMIVEICALVIFIAVLWFISHR